MTKYHGKIDELLAGIPPTEMDWYTVKSTIVYKHVLQANSKEEAEQLADEMPQGDAEPYYKKYTNGRYWNATKLNKAR